VNAFGAEVAKMAKDEAEWLPVGEFHGVEYVVDIQNRRFGQLQDRTEIVTLHSDEGREMVRAMVGMEWRAWTPRETLDDREGVA